MTLEDVEQEAWVAAVLASKRHDSKSSALTTFVYAYVFHALRDIAKTRRIRAGNAPEVSIDAPHGGDEEDWTLHDTLGTLANQEDAVDLAKFEAAMKALPAHVAKLVSLNAQGFSYEEIAKNNNSTPDAVRKACQKARQTMKDVA